MSIRIVLADDQPLVRQGLAVMLRARPDLEVVAEAANGREAVDRALAHRADVVLMDVRMPVLDGIAATRELVRAGAATRVLVLTTYDVDDYVLAALRAGAGGFLLKDVRPDELAEAVRHVAAGDAALAPSAARRLVEHVAATPDLSAARSADRPGRDAVDALTGREREVVVLLARGLSNAEIAASLVLGEATVKTHVSAVLRKLGLRDRIQAVVWAHEVGLIGDR